MFMTNITNTNTDWTTLSANCTRMLTDIGRWLTDIHIIQTCTIGTAMRIEAPSPSLHVRASHKSYCLASIRPGPYRLPTLIPYEMNFPGGGSEVSIVPAGVNVRRRSGFEQRAELQATIRIVSTDCCLDQSCQTRRPNHVAWKRRFCVATSSIHLVASGGIDRRTLLH
jgi:hypothetical protein